MPRATSFIEKECIDCGKLFRIYFYETKKIREKRDRCMLCSKKQPNNGQFKKTGSMQKSNSRIYKNAHRFIKRKRGMPQECEVCKTNDKSVRYEWSNVDHKYRQKVEDFTRMCTKCHWHYDFEHNLRGKRKSNCAVKTNVY